MNKLRLPRAGKAAAVLAGLLALLLSTASVASAAVIMHGTFATSNREGTISYKPLRAFRGGSEGTFAIAGKSYPGSMYAATTGGTGLAWYYGTSGIMAGNALVTLQPSGAYSGPIWFFARTGSITESGSVSVTFP